MVPRAPSPHHSEVAACLLGALDAAIAAADWRVADSIVKAIETLARERGCRCFLDQAYRRIERLSRGPGGAGG